MGNADARRGKGWDLNPPPPDHGVIIRCHFTPNREIEAKIKEETKATVRCIPFAWNSANATPGKDIYTGQETTTQVLFAQSY
jgi:prolyl-tRNA synthetase